MDVPDSLYFMLDIIKEMTYTIVQEKKRVLVHCHAGYGRTGIVLACYKVYNDNVTADEAVRHIRQTRPKCIEQKSQMKYCIKFYQCK
jgi:protein tyrosine phosphatase domain-containing protein 1